MNIKNRVEQTDYIIWWVAIMWLIIDSINGYFIYSGISIPLSQTFKLSVLFVVLVNLSRNKRSLMGIIIIISYLIIYSIHLNVYGYPLTHSLLPLSKFLTLVLFYIYFRYSLIKNQKYSINSTYKVFTIGGLIILLNIILGLFGYGTPSYGDDQSDLGVKGFIFAGNEIGGMLAVILPFIFYVIFISFKGFKLFVYFFLLIIISICLGTKTSILVTLISALTIPYIYLNKKKRNWLLLVFVIILLGLMFIYIQFFSEHEIGALSRWIFFYNKGGINELVFSGRDEFWYKQSQTFFNSSFSSQLLGLGSDGDIIERDNLDALVIYGYIGACLIIGFLLFLLFFAIYKRHNNKLCKLVIFSDILIIGIGYYAGHVWFSAMASIYIALLNALVIIKTKDNLFKIKKSI